MRKEITLVSLLLAAIVASCAQQQAIAEDGAAADAPNATASYAIGANLGRSLHDQEVPVDVELIIQGLRDAFAGNELRYTNEEMGNAMNAMQTEMQAKMQEKQSAQAATNKVSGEAFLAENAKRPEVKTTASGLQYEVLSEGDGPSPTAADTVTVHYRGTLVDGTVFDSSYDRGQPATFPLNGVIPGWTEGLQLMKTGAKYKLFLPASLGYGDRGAGAEIGPGATLIFEVELLSIKGK